MEISALLAVLGPKIKGIVRDVMRDMQGDMRVAGDGVVTGRFSAQNFSWGGRELELGWIKDNVIWIYGSATTILIYGDDASERFPTGTKLRWKQGGSYQYATVTGVSYTDGTTTVTVSGDSVSNTDLTDNYFSYQSTPPGWTSAAPGSFVGAKVYRTTNQSIDPSNAWEDLVFDNEAWDTDGIHSNSVNPERLTCKTPGKYAVTAYFRGQTGLTLAAIYKNNSSYEVLVPVPDKEGIPGLTIPLRIALNVDDYLTFRVFNTTTGALNVTAADDQPFFSMEKID